MKRFFAYISQTLVVTVALSIGIVAYVPAKAQVAEVRTIVFPVLGAVSYGDDFGNPRTDHAHEGNDLMAPKMRPLIAAVDGVVSWVQYPEPSWGYAISLTDNEGYQYWYLHVNNDNVGTDDGLGGGLNAYARDIINGATVVKGEQIGWVGDSGNAEGTSPHLHFEIHAPDGTHFDPYASLQAATKISVPVKAPKQPYEILPYGEFKGGCTIALGHNGSDDLLVSGAGPGGSPHVKVMNQDGSLISQFFPFPKAFKGGVNVATGDVNGDGVDEIISGAGPGGGPQVRIFRADGQPLGGFFAYPLGFRGGVRVVVGDIDGDGQAEIITGAGPGGGPQVRIFKANSTVVGSFMAYALTFRGGVDVAVKPMSSASPAQIITAALSNGGPQVRIFDTSGNPKVSFFAYAENFRGGVKVAVTNIDQSVGTFDIITVPASKGGPDIRVFSSLGLLTNSTKAFEPWWRGGYEIAVNALGKIYVSANNRRASIRVANSPFGGFSNNNPISGRGHWRYLGD